MATKLYVLMFVDLELDSDVRNTTVLGVFSTAKKAVGAITDKTRTCFYAEDAPITTSIRDSNDEDGSHFLIQSFVKDMVNDDDD